MRVNNYTHWNSKQLRKLFAACLKEIRRREGQRKELHKQVVTIKIHRSHTWIGGRAPYHWNILTIKIPALRFEVTSVTDKKNLDFVQCIADTYIHEVGHNLGMRHHRITGYPVVCTMEHLYRQWILDNISEAKFPLTTNASLKRQSKAVSVRPRSIPAQRIELQPAL